MNKDTSAMESRTLRKEQGAGEGDQTLDEYHGASEVDAEEESYASGVMNKVVVEDVDKYEEDKDEEEVQKPAIRNQGRPDLRNI